MTNLKNLQTMNIDKLVDWLDENGHHDAIWWKWFEKKYCENCPMETVMVPHHVGEGPGGSEQPAAASSC